VATGYLSTQTSRQGLVRIISRLQHPKKAQRGLLPQLSAQLSRTIPEALDDIYMEVAGVLEGRLIPRRTALADSVTRAMDAIGMALLAHLGKGKDLPGEQKLRLTPPLYATPFWQEVEERVRQLSEELDDYGGGLRAFFKACEKLPDKVVEKLSGNLVDLRGIKGRLEATVENLRFFIARDDDFCRWFEVRKTGKGLAVKLCSSPMDVADAIKAAILDKFRTVVLTSATLAVGERFDYLERRTGISLLPRSRVTELLLASPFDYDRQAFVGIPADIPEPNAPGFEAALVELLLKSLSISQGRAFVLFTSYDLLGRVYNRLNEPLTRIGINPMRQGELNRHLLLSRFRKEKNAVLFGTDSFWEGVDVKGKALELVVIARLPFRVPTEPILEARAEHIAANGGDPFMEYAVPQAVIKFKQGFGRLIRSRDDRGAVLILDSRVLTKNYGKAFLRSLPGAPVAKGSGAEVLEAMAGFFSSSPR
jgi:ATP-dependent DNA helicase DinG